MFLVLSCLFFCVSSQFITYPTAFDGSTYVPPTGTSVTNFGVSEADTSISSSHKSYELRTAYSEWSTSSLTGVTSKSVSAASTSSISTRHTPDSEVSTSSSSTSNTIIESSGLLESNDGEYDTSTTVIRTYYETVPCTTTSTSSSFSSSTTSISVPNIPSPITGIITTSNEPSSASHSSSSSLTGVPNDSHPIVYSTSSTSANSAFKSSIKTASTPSFKSGAKYNSSSYCSPTIVISTVTVTGRVVTKTELALTTVTSIVS